MYKLRNRYYIFIATLILSSCNMIEYHPYDCNITGANNLTNINIEKIEQLSYSDTLRFALISDTQRWYNDTYDLVKALNCRNDISFVVHCGDLTDFGATNEFVWMRDILQKLHHPYVCLIGNHDFLGTGLNAYNHIYGDLNFSFTAGETRFLCVNTNALEYDDNDLIPDMQFLDNELEKITTKIKNTIVAIHAEPFSEQFNNKKTHIFHKKINEFPNLLCVLTGHGHSFHDKELFEDGTHYIMCPCVHEREYIIFTIVNGKQSYEICEF